jgi:hypothetical protein
VLASLQPLADLGALEVAALCLAAANADKEVANALEYFGVGALESQLRAQLGDQALEALLLEGAALDRTAAVALAIETINEFVS